MSGKGHHKQLGRSGRDKSSSNDYQIIKEKKPTSGHGHNPGLGLLLALAAGADRHAGTGDRHRHAGAPARHAGAGFHVEAGYKAQMVNAAGSVYQFGENRVVDIQQSVGGSLHEHLIKQKVFAHQDRHGNQEVVLQQAVAERVVRPAGHAAVGHARPPELHHAAAQRAIEAPGPSTTDKQNAHNLRRELLIDRTQNRISTTKKYGDRKWNLCHVIATSSNINNVDNDYVGILTSPTVFPMLVELAKAQDTLGKTPAEVAKEFGNAAALVQLFNTLKQHKPAASNATAATLSQTVPVGQTVTYVPKPDAGDAKAVDQNALVPARKAATPQVEPSAPVVESTSRPFADRSVDSSVQVTHVRGTADTKADETPAEVRVALTAAELGGTTKPPHKHDIDAHTDILLQSGDLEKDGVLKMYGPPASSFEHRRGSFDHRRGRSVEYGFSEDDMQRDDTFDLTQVADLSPKRCNY